MIHGLLGWGVLVILTVLEMFRVGSEQDRHVDVMTARPWADRDTLRVREGDPGGVGLGARGCCMVQPWGSGGSYSHHRDPKRSYQVTHVGSGVCRQHGERGTRDRMQAKDGVASISLPFKMDSGR